MLIGDNLSSHFNENVLKLSKENDIRFVCLPPNATHLCQPLDVAFFRPMKIEWRKILTKFKESNRRLSTVPKDMFPDLLKQLHIAIEPNMAKNLRQGFMACGINPFNPEEVLKKVPTKPAHGSLNGR